MSQDVTDSSFEGDVTLFYSVKSEDDLIGDSIFNEISKKTHKFKYVPWVSNVLGRINAKIIFDKSGKFRNKEFFLCGPTGFKQGTIESLIKNGVSKHHIHEEVFDFR